MEDGGYRLGTVNDVIVDFDAQTIYGLYVERTNDGLVEYYLNNLEPKAIKDMASFVESLMT